MKPTSNITTKVKACKEQNTVMKKAISNKHAECQAAISVMCNVHWCLMTPKEAKAIKKETHWMTTT